MFEKILLIWIYSLTFMSGMLNAITVVFFSVSVSHFTGTITSFSASVASKNFSGVMTSFSMIVAFIMGCFISGFFTNEREFNLQKRYGFILVSLGTTLGIFRLIFQEPKFAFILFLPFMLGIQNGMMLSYNGLIIRTTHMSGNVTDFGAYMGHYFKGSKRDLRKALYSFFNIMVFISGGISGVTLYGKFGYEFFYVISCFYILCGTSYFFIRKNFYKEKLEEETKIENTEH